MEGTRHINSAAANRRRIGGKAWGKGKGSVAGKSLVPAELVQAGAGRGLRLSLESGRQRAAASVRKGSGSGSAPGKRIGSA